MTSNQYFAINKYSFDLIFIDGLHHADQVYKDINNALKVLSSKGTIVVHDCNPIDENAQMIPRKVRRWNGDVWKAWVRLRTERDDINMVCLDMDYGCGIITKGKQKLLDKGTDSYEVFDKNRKKYLNLISVEDWTNELEGTTGERPE